MHHWNSEETRCDVFSDSIRVPQQERIAVRMDECQFEALQLGTALDDWPSLDVAGNSWH